MHEAGPAVCDVLPVTCFMCTLQVWILGVTGVHNARALLAVQSERMHRPICTRNRWKSDPCGANRPEPKDCNIDP